MTEPSSENRTVIAPGSEPQLRTPTLKATGSPRAARLLWVSMSKSVNLGPSGESSPESQSGSDVDIRMIETFCGLMRVRYRAISRDTRSSSSIDVPVWYEPITSTN
jgi:hypothetical protein